MYICMRASVLLLILMSYILNKGTIYVIIKNNNDF